MKNAITSEPKPSPKDHNLALELMNKQLVKNQKEMNYLLQNERNINEMKSRFVSIASHEFRSPLSSIQLSAALIENYHERMDADKIRYHLRKIRISVKELMEVLDDFLSVERIERGGIQPVFTIFDLESFFKDIISEMNIHKERNQQICYEHEGKDIFCYQDLNLIKHCVTNLISNAIKYSKDDGIINIQTELDEKFCRICVRDNGIGIPLKDQLQLFTPFYRATNTGSIPGTGLGLSIVEKYTRLMNGTIKLESNPGMGTKVTLLFPLNDKP
ncbi:HAMP domain-containing histidine kinase [Pedobacter sp. MC2016-14]|uniref:sensor histidine kinase n=1 Tax=Pedobacter sp. MC2016-14 TaxID=2897327 RepID=UPI001E2F04BC|nr:HAMP domain-containing sensor histidine kinase [Pedobacter sp. MC2016-14]MCD0487829.1 HAMP domain-containing histidine kinase [Pedobacter sp. MC2016-14]